MEHSETQTGFSQTPKAAFVAVIGRPSVGKSTLVNCICGEKVSIVSAVPQTTRSAIRGIVNREQGQLVFIDTPGRYKSAKKTNKKLLDISAGAIEDADLILYVMDASRSPGAEDEETAALIAPHADRTAAAVNKIDLAGNAPGSAGCEAAFGFLSRSLTAVPAERIFPVSAKTGDGIEALLSTLYDLAPEGEPFYSAEYYTDQEVDFRIAEIIREQAINRLRQELPHALRVEIADAQFTEAASDGRVPETQGAPEGRLWVRAFIVVERESQKGIVVGAGGAMIKAIRLAALKELRKIFDWKIELDLRVK